jgi:hypothetical protein
MRFARAGVPVMGKDSLEIARLGHTPEGFLECVTHDHLGLGSRQRRQAPCRLVVGREHVVKERRLLQTLRVGAEPLDEVLLPQVRVHEARRSVGSDSVSAEAPELPPIAARQAFLAVRDVGDAGERLAQAVRVGPRNEVVGHGYSPTPGPPTPPPWSSSSTSSSFSSSASASSCHQFSSCGSPRSSRSSSSAPATMAAHTSSPRA